MALVHPDIDEEWSKVKIHVMVIWGRLMAVFSFEHGKEPLTPP